jgi:hypothetical protein
MKEGTQYIIGFGGLYFTLWTAYSYKEYRADGTFYFKTNFTYQYNLSHSLEEAEEKVRKMEITDYIVDEGMRGEKWQIAEYEREMISPEFFAVGANTGTLISKSDDFKSLLGAYYNDNNARRRVNARRRLINLGYFVKHTWEEEKVGSINSYFVKRSYMPKKMYNNMIQRAGQKNGHFYEDKERVELDIKLVKAFNYETRYGTMFIDIYIDRDNRVFKYKGGNPPEVSREDFTTVKGTIKHSEYKGENETLIQRIKIL